MSVNNNKMMAYILEIFIEEILYYGISIYDLQNISCCCHNILSSLIEKNKQNYLIKKLVEINVDHIFKKQFNINYNIFQSFCSTSGLVLGGSTMLKAMTGDSWGWSSNDINIVQHMKIAAPINDIDLHIDHSKGFDLSSDIKFSENIRQHKLTFDPIQSKNEDSGSKIKYFLQKYLLVEDYVSIIDEYNSCLLSENLDEYLNESAKDIEDCFIILIDVIFKNRLLLLNNSHETIDDEGSFFSNIIFKSRKTDNDIYNSNFNKFVIELKLETDIWIKGTEPKIQVIFGFENVDETFMSYDFPFLGSSISYKINNITNKYNNTINFRKTIPYILKRNRNEIYRNGSFLKCESVNTIQEYLNDPRTNIFNQTQNNRVILYPMILMNMRRNLYESNITNKYDYETKFFDYCNRIENIFNRSYMRMVKYHRRGFNVFSVCNINDSNFISFIESESLPVNTLFSNYANSKYIQRFFDKQLSEIELTILNNDT
jgi:hypothetical protein